MYVSTLIRKLPLEHALGDGEDFELMLAVPPTEAERLLADKPLDVAITCIGEFVKGGGLWALEEQGQRRELPAEGYRHGST